MRTSSVDRLLRGIAPLVITMVAASGCSTNAELRYNGREGVPLAELDLGGAAPDEVTLLGPDRVLIGHGGAFAITVDGGPERSAPLRFVLAEGSLGIMREPGSWSDASPPATIRVTLPAPPERLTVTGSGAMVSERLAGSARVLVAGSGSLETPRVEAETLAISITGSGTYRAGGRVQQLDLSVAGSGDADLAGLRADRAEISIAGSGDAVLASDGEVNGAIMGSGSVFVRGAARCRIRTMGSGTLTCERAGQAA